MYCSDIEDLLSSYLDHELSPEESSFVEKHLQHCSSCRQDLMDLQETSNLLQMLPNVPMPDGFQEHFHELLVGVDRDTYMSAKGRLGQNWIQWLFSSYRLASAALVLVICFAVYSFSTFYKNTSYTDQAPALMSAESAISHQGERAELADQEVGAELKSREKVIELEKDANLNTLPIESESTNKTNKLKGQLPFFIALLVAVSLLVMKIISKFRIK